MYRVFLSYASEDTEFARQFRDALRSERIEGFLTPLDVTPSTEWVVTLEGELRESGALIAVLTPAFRRSKWCDQEVGYALGLGHVVVPVCPTMADPTPYGLLGRFQAVMVNRRPLSEVAAEIFDVLLAHQEPAASLVDLVIDALAEERDAERVRLWLSRLKNLRHLLDPGRRARVTLLADQNSILQLDSNAYATVSAILG